MARILIVDDDDEILEFIRQCLSVDHVVEAIGDGMRALYIAKRTPFDLVLTDIVMQNIDGLEVIRELKACFPDIKLVAMSAGLTSIQMDVLKVAEALGAHKTLAKPFTPQELMSCIQEVLAT